MKTHWRFLLITLLSLAACSEKNSFSPDDEDMQQAKQVTLFESKDSQNKWILQSAEVDFEDLEHAVLVQPRLILRENGQDSAEVSGDRGILNYAKKIVRIEGNARVHSLSENILLTTDHFSYDINKDLVWSDDKTWITRGNTKITAKKGIETDSKLKQIKFKNQITQLPTDPAELQGVKK